MWKEPITLEGEHVRLEPLAESHAGALVAAAPGDTELYRWSPVPLTRADALAYIETALAWQAAGTAIRFATVRRGDGRVIGSTCFFHVEYWSVPRDSAWFSILAAEWRAIRERLRNRLARA